MKAPLHPWIFTDRPWARLHIEYCGPISGIMLLVIIDSHSKWLEVHIASMATSKITIEHLRITFSTHGIPDTIVSENASCFTINEFIHFCKMNGIKHITSAPYHPSTNGMVERAVQTVKEGLNVLLVVLLKHDCLDFYVRIRLHHRQQHILHQLNYL